jgi:plastocyanin
MRATNLMLLGVAALAAAAVPLTPTLARTATPAPALAPTASVDIVNFRYNQPEVTVAVGTTVTWKNTADRPHTVTDRGGTFDSRIVEPGTTSTVTFTAPGTYFYFCRVNPAKMNGVIHVQGGAQPSKVVRVQAVDPSQFLTHEQFRFDPPSLSVPAGSVLLLANVGSKPHTLTADDGSFDTGVVAPGSEGGRFAGHSATIRLDKPGTFAFHCEIHPQKMKGTITVTGAATQQAQVSSAPQQARVAVADFLFRPPEVSVAPGGKVTFANGGKVTHTATFDDVPLDTHDIAAGATATLTAPTKPGSYSYRCAIHPGKMRGLLVVLGAGTDDPTKVAAAAPAAVVQRGGPGGGITGLGLASGVLGAFLAGVGLAGFVLGRRRRPA